jgi:colanic acid/amylovoran biosynthesis glycosyltransferase
VVRSVRAIVALVRVLVLTTSYPRDGDDASGRFVADSVASARSRGVEVVVVSPLTFANYGIALGHGILGNLRARPWRAAALPAFIASFRRAAVRAVGDADLVHAHWLLAGLVAATLGKPYVVQVWGTDVELARRAPWLARPILSRARLVIAASDYLAAEAETLGARVVEVVPSSVTIPTRVTPPDDPPHVLFAGRLSAEKGLLEFVAATAGLPRRIVGDGPLRARVPDATGFVPRSELQEVYRRAAVVCAPSRREGYGVVPREAMAWGRPVVAAAVGGLMDAVQDGVTGLLVPPGDVRALRAAIERLLGDADLRNRLGANAREYAESRLSPEAQAAATLRAYEIALARPRGAPG